MDFFQALILSFVEGVTEFLPISSTGHLVLATKILAIPQTEFVKSFEIFIQLGAMLAVVVLYGKKYIKNIPVWKNVFIAFLPTAIVGFFLYKVIKQYLLGNTTVTLLALLIGGILLIVLEKIYKEKDHHVESIENISAKNAFLIGVCQSLAIIPGVSRSAATIIGALFLGTKRKTAVEFSFLLAVPTLFAASALDLTKMHFAFTKPEYTLLGIGLLGSFISSFLVIKLFLRYIEKYTLIPFGIYRIIIAILFWLIVIR